MVLHQGLNSVRVTYRLYLALDANIGTKTFEKAQSKTMRDYAQSGQYHIIVEIRHFQSCYQFQRFNLKV